MKQFNIARGYKVVLYGNSETKQFPFKVPYGAFYGKDSCGYYICIHHKKPANNESLNIFRYSHSIGWYKRKENATQAYRIICKTATKYNLWDVKVWKSELNTIKSFCHHDRYFKGSALKRGGQIATENREKTGMIVKLHPAELTFKQDEFTISSYYTCK